MHTFNIEFSLRYRVITQNRLSYRCQLYADWE